MKVHAKNAAAYLVLTAVAVLFMIYLDGPSGSYLLIALVSALLLSVALCIYTKLAVSADISTDTDILDIDDTLTVKVHFKKRGVLPSSILSAELHSDYRFEAEGSETLKTSLFGSDEAVCTAKYRAVFFGKGKIVLSRVTVTDHLGIFSFFVMPETPYEEVRVYPDIPDTDSADGLLQAITQAALFEDSEETVAANFSASGTPGYEHRKYIAGDSLRLINWKLSAKRSELYVRRLESSAAVQQVFILDNCAGDSEKETHIAQENTVEALLSVSLSLSKSEIPIKLIICMNDYFEAVEIGSPADVTALRYKFTDYKFGGGSRFPAELPESAVVFTPSFDEGAADATKGKTGITFVAGSAKLTADTLRMIARESNDLRFI